MNKEVKDYGSFCKSKKCPEFIEWNTGYGNCESCKLVGQSYTVSEYPENCLYLQEIRKI